MVPLLSRFLLGFEQDVKLLPILGFSGVPAYVAVLFALILSKTVVHMRMPQCCLFGPEQDGKLLPVLVCHWQQHVRVEFFSVLFLLLIHTASQLSPLADAQTLVFTAPVSQRFSLCSGCKSVLE